MIKAPRWRGEWNGMFAVKSIDETTRKRRGSSPMDKVLGINIAVKDILMRTILTVYHQSILFCRELF